MDGLTFGSTYLLRHLTASESKKLPIREYCYNKILEELQLSKEEFIDLCILMGCDYCESIKGIGPKKALDLITQHRSIEKIVENLGNALVFVSKFKMNNRIAWTYEKFVSFDSGTRGNRSIFVFVCFRRPLCFSI